MTTAMGGYLCSAFGGVLCMLQLLRSDAGQSRWLDHRQCSPTSLAKADDRVCCGEWCSGPEGDERIYPSAVH